MPSRVDKSESRWCPQCGAEYLPQMETCSDCFVLLVDRQPREHQGSVEYDLRDWSLERLRVLCYQLNDRRIWWSHDDGVLRVRPTDERTVDALIDGVEESYVTIPDQPDAFILPNGRRYSELPVGPDVPRAATPVDWIEERSWSFRWFMAGLRDFLRRLGRRK